MRDITRRMNTERSSKTKSIRSKYIFAFEGYSTEICYFKGLADYKNIAGIKDLVNLCILQREDIDSGCSDPLKLLEILEKHISSMKEGRHTPETLSERIRGEIGKNLDWGRNDTRLNKLNEKIMSSLNNDADDRGFIIDCDTAISKCEKIVEEETGKHLCFPAMEPEEYDSCTDHVCVLIDRDRESHSPQKIDDYISKCKRLGFEPYITNPCFEFWLILHFEESYKLDQDVLEKNPMKDGKRFTETELDRILNEVNPENHYCKTELDPQMFMHRIGEAINNSKTYCNDINCLKHKVGTNLGRLFESMCSSQSHLDILR